MRGPQKRWKTEVVKRSNSDFFLHQKPFTPNSLLHQKTFCTTFCVKEHSILCTLSLALKIIFCARPPQMELAAKQFRETSSKTGSGRSENESVLWDLQWKRGILRGVIEKWKFTSSNLNVEDLIETVHPQPAARQTLLFPLHQRILYEKVSRCSPAISLKHFKTCTFRTRLVLLLRDRFDWQGSRGC